MKEVLDATVGMIFGVTPSQMSLLYFLHYVHCAGGFSVIVDADEKGYAQEWRIKVKDECITSRRNVWKLRRQPWPSGQRVGLAIRRSRVRVPLCHLLDLYSVVPSSNPRPRL